MGIRGFGSMFGEQQSGDVANVGIDLFFDMLFDSLSKVSSFYSMASSERCASHFNQY